MQRFKETEKAGSVLGTAQELVELIVQRVILTRLIKTVDNTTHPVHW